MHLPKISIVTPSFNQGRFLEETIQSVVGQDYPNLEYVLIDGGSTDDSVNIIRRYEAKLHYWVSGADGGHGNAINKGFQHTSGDIMAWINSDDKYTPWSFKTVAEIFSKFPHVMWIVGFNSWWNSAGAMTSASRVPINIFDFLLGRYAWIQQESVFWRRELWDKAGGHINEDYRFMVDGELWARFFLHEHLYSVDSVLGGYRVHPENRAGHNYSECLKEMNRAIQEMRRNCSSDVLETDEQLRVLRGIGRNVFLNVPLSRLVRKLMYPLALKNAEYKNISWQKEMWVERALQFEL